MPDKYMFYKRLLIFLAVLAVVGCENNLAFSNKQVVLSPSGKAKAVILDDGVLAEGHKAYKIYLVFADQEKVKVGNEVFKSIDTSDLKVLWKGDEILEINYARAVVTHFQNVAIFLNHKNKRGYYGSVLVKIPETTWVNISNRDIGGEGKVIRGVKLK